MSSSRFQTVLEKLQHPIIQAPMAGAQGHALAIAVARAGGLGSIPAAMLSPAQLHSELTAMHAAGIDCYNVNFFCHTAPDATQQPAQQAHWLETLAPHYRAAQLEPSVNATAAREAFNDALCDVIAPFKPKVVSCHFGLPSAALVERIKSWGGCVLSSATTVAEALWLKDHGADAIIAQGLEAGGHRGVFLCDDPLLAMAEQVGLFALLPQIVAAVAGTPVIAAGGIANAASVRAARALGASAVQAGTAFLQCPESLTSAVHRAALRRLDSEGAVDARRTALTNLFTGRPARGIVNHAMGKLGAINTAAPSFPMATAAIAPLRTHYEAQGLPHFTPLWAGQYAAASQAVPAAQVVADLAAGLHS